MMISTIKSKLFSILKILIAVAFWLAVWQIVAITVDKTYFVPRVEETFAALFKLIAEGKFFLTVFFTILRVISGLILGIALGILLAVLCHYSKIFETVFTPIITVIKSTPVASFITLLWIMMDGNALSIIIALLMVMPIVYQNVLNGYDAIDKELLEVTEVFEFNYSKKVRYLIAPTVKRYLIPAIISASGLAWKAEIAAEIMGYVKNSIGGQINDAISYSDSPTKFAWTLVIITLSLILERFTKYLLKRVKNESVN